MGNEYELWMGLCCMLAAVGAAGMAVQAFIDFRRARGAAWLRRRLGLSR